MNVARCVFCACITIILGANAFGDPFELADLHKSVVGIYSFSPQKLNKDEIASKSKELDSFWNSMKSKGDRALPKLREELKRSDNPSFFYYDGSKLLLSLSRDKGDKQLAATAISRADLRDVQTSDYVATINRLAGEGIDTTLAACRVLDYPDFKVFVPAHALTLGQNYSFILMLFPLDDNVYSGHLMTRIKGEKSIEARKSLLLMAWYTATRWGDDLVSGAATDPDEKEEVKRFAGQLRKQNESIAALPVEKIAELKNQYDFGQILRKMPPGFLASADNNTLSRDDMEGVTIIVKSLWASGQPMGKDIVKGIAEDSTAPKEIRDYAEAVMKGDPGGVKAPVTEGTVLPESAEELKRQRQKVLSGLNDEVLHDFDGISVLIRWKQSRK